MCVNDLFQFCASTVHTLRIAFRVGKKRSHMQIVEYFSYDGFFFLANRKKILTRIIPIDLLSLYVLLSQYRSCDNTVEKIFFSNFVLLTCISTHNLWKYKGSRSLPPPPLGPLFRENEMYKLKRSIPSRYMGLFLGPVYMEVGDPS